MDQGLARDVLDKKFTLSSLSELKYWFYPIFSLSCLDAQSIDSLTNLIRKEIKMKVLSLALFMFCVSASAFAGPLDGPQAAERLQAKIEPSVMSMTGVAGIGITGCNPNTGLPDVEGDFVHCVQIFAETQNAANSLIKTYPAGVKVDGVFVTIDLSGQIVIYPRMTGGN